MPKLLRKSVNTTDGQGRCVGYLRTPTSRYMVQFPADKQPKKALEYRHNNVACYAWYLAKNVQAA